MDPESRVAWREHRHLLPPRSHKALKLPALLQHACCRHFHLVVLFWWRLRQRCSILASAELLKRHSLLWICEVRLFLTADAADYAWQPTIDSPPCFSFITCSWTRLRHTNELLSWLLCQKTFPCCFLLFFVSDLCFYVFLCICVYLKYKQEKKTDLQNMIICKCYQSFVHVSSPNLCTYIACLVGRCASNSL